MSDDKHIVLSYGGGVNSTAILALCKLGELPRPDYIVFSDTGAEWPHTYSYLSYIDIELEKIGKYLTYLTGGNKGMTLIEFCQMKSFIPSRMNRWCTDYWKRSPIMKLAKAVGATQWIGIDAGEARRAEGKGKIASYPLIEFGLNRKGCKEIIKKAGLGVPQKSGCFICPYQRKSQWVELKRERPDMWEIAVNLEQASIKNKEGFTFVNNMTISEFVADADKQEELPFGFVLDQKCECYFD